MNRTNDNNITSKSMSKRQVTDSMFAFTITL